jgi:hypothetical protein
MGKFTVYQSNKYITSLKLRSRRRASGCYHSVGFGGRPASHSPCHKKPKTAKPVCSVCSMDTSPTRVVSFPEPRLGICPVPPADVED